MSEILEQANETTSLNSIYMQANTRLLHIMKGISQVLKCGRFLLRHKVSSDKMLMSGSNPYENNSCPPDLCIIEK